MARRVLLVGVRSMTGNQQQPGFIRGALITLALLTLACIPTAALLGSIPQ